MTLKYLIINTCETNYARIFGKGKLEAICLAETLAFERLDKHLGLELECKFLNTKVLEVVVLQEHGINGETERIDRDARLKAQALGKQLILGEL